MACSSIYNKYDQQKRKNPPRYDLPLGSADSLKQSRWWFLQTSLQAAQIWISPGRTIAPTDSTLTETRHSKQGTTCSAQNSQSACAATSLTLTLREANLRWCSSDLFAPSAFLSSLSISCDNSLAMFTPKFLRSSASCGQPLILPVRGPSACNGHRSRSCCRCIA